jgi:hypothetical protein
MACKKQFRSPGGIETSSTYIIPASTFMGLMDAPTITLYRHEEAPATLHDYGSRP